MANLNTHFTTEGQHIRSFVSRRYLDRFIEQRFGDCWYIVVKTEDDCYTAIFLASFNKEIPPMQIATLGFMVFS